MVKSIGEFKLDTVFTTQPEFAIFAAYNGGTLEDMPSVTLCTTLLANDTQSYKTLLNPDNMRVFYTYYSEKAYNNIMTRFGFSTVH
jgi:hypothetical protein